MPSPEITSPSFPTGLPPLRSEVQARRDRLEADLRAEGASDATVSRLATDEAAERMVLYEDQCVGAIYRMFGGRT